MAKITELLPAEPLTGNEHVPLVQNGVTRRGFIGSHILSLAIPYVAQAEEARDITIASAAIFYPTKELGEEASGAGTVFAVAPGDGTATYWRKGNPSQELFEMATKALVDNKTPIFYNLSDFKDNRLRGKATLMTSAGAVDYSMLFGDYSGITIDDDVYIQSNHEPLNVAVWKKNSGDLTALSQGGTVADAIKWVTPQMFGAKADWSGSTGTDDTDAIQAAYDAAKAANLTLNIPQGRYRASKGLHFDSNITVHSDGAVFYDDSNTPGNCLEISAPAGQLLRRARILGHLAVEKVNTDWSLPRDGVFIQNSYMGQFHLSVLRFRKGITLHSNMGGCVYNQIYLNQLTNNKWSTFLSCETSEGWTNQNIFWGGRYSNGVNDVGCHIVIDDSLYGCNGNSWQSPSLEASYAPYSLFNIQGTHNSIIGGRYEHGGDSEYWGELGGTRCEIAAHSAPYLSEGRVNITGTLYRIITSNGTRRSSQGGEAIERQGDGPVLSLRNLNGEGGLEILTPAGVRAVSIAANQPWEVYNGKKVLWRSSAAPIDGTWSRGDVVFVTSPVKGGPIGYVCVTAGSPGLWEPFGIAGAVQAENVAYAAGAQPTKVEFDALIDALKTAGLMS